MKVIGRDDNALAELKKHLEGLPRPIPKVKKVREPRSKEDSFFDPPAPKFVTSAERAAAAACTRMLELYQSLWLEKNFPGRCGSWTNRERKNIKDFITEQGEKSVSIYIKYCLQNWKEVSYRYKIMSAVPTVPILYGYRKSLLAEALEPSKKPVGHGPAEYTETDLPSGSWG